MKSKLRGIWVVAALGWSAALALASCAVEPATAPGEGTSETQQQGRWEEPPWDTICGDHLCSGQEDALNCPEDCAPGPDICGNGVCGNGESYLSCPADCPQPVVCGDGVCSPGENCPYDCTPVTCGDCICHPGETSSCPWDCNVPGYPTWCIGEP